MKARIILLALALFSVSALLGCSKPLPTADEVQQQKQAKEDKMLKDSGNE